MIHSRSAEPFRCASCSARAPSKPEPSNMIILHASLVAPDTPARIGDRRSGQPADVAGRSLYFAHGARNPTLRFPLDYKHRVRTDKLAIYKNDVIFSLPFALLSTVERRSFVFLLGGPFPVATRLLRALPAQRPSNWKLRARAPVHLLSAPNCFSAAGSRSRPNPSDRRPDAPAKRLGARIQPNRKRRPDSQVSVTAARSP